MFNTELNMEAFHFKAFVYILCMWEKKAVCNVWLPAVVLEDVLGGGSVLQAGINKTLQEVISRSTSEVSQQNGVMWRACNCP